MGLFSSKKKVYVSSSVVSLNPTGSEKRAVPSILLMGMQQKADNLSDYLITGLVNGRGNQIKKFYNWANNSGYLDVLGHTSSSIFTNAKVDTSTVQKILTQRLNLKSNQSIQVDYAVIGPYEIDNAAKHWTSNNKPSQVNKISNVTSSYDWQSKEIKITITYSSGSSVTITQNQWDTTQTFLYVDYTLITEEEHILGITTYDKESRFYMYQRYSGIPEFDALFNVFLNQRDTIYPIIPFMHYGAWVASNSSDSYLKNTVYPWAKKAYKKLYGDNGYDKMLKQIQETDNIGDVSFMYIQPGVAINTDYPAGKKYIRDFFMNIYQNMLLDGQGTSNTTYTPNLSGYIKKTFTSIKTLYVKTGGICNFNNSYTWTGMTLDIKTGVIGKLNEVKIFRKDNGYWYTYDCYCNSSSEDYSICECKTWIDIKDVVIQYQTSSNSYEELRVSNLNYNNTIYDGKSASYNAWDELANSDDDSFFHIPLEQNTIKSVGLVKRTDLAACCMYMVANAYKVKKVKWYQKGIFKVILGAISITIGTLTGGLGGLILQGLGAFFLTAGALQILSKFLVSILGTFGAFLYSVISAIVKIVLIAVATYFGGPLAGAGAAFMYSMAESWAQGNSFGQAFKAGLISGVITLATLAMGNYMEGIRGTQMFTSNAVGIKALDALTNTLDNISNILKDTIKSITNIFDTTSSSLSSGSTVSTVTGNTESFIDKLGNNYELITKVGDVTVNLGTSIYKDRIQRKYTNKLYELNSHLDSKLKELQNKSNELLGASAVAWAQMYILNGGALYIPETYDMFLSRGLMCWTDVINVQMNEISNITNLNCNTLLPAVSV